MELGRVSARLYPKRRLPPVVRARPSVQSGSQAAAQSRPTASVLSVAPRSTSIPYYSDSRIFKDIKVVSDLRQSGSERGETQTGDSGHLGPVAPPKHILKSSPQTVDNKKLIPVALAIAAFLLFKG